MKEKEPSGKSSKEEKKGGGGKEAKQQQQQHEAQISDHDLHMTKKWTHTVYMGAQRLVNAGQAARQQEAEGKGDRKQQTEPGGGLLGLMGESKATAAAAGLPAGIQFTQHDAAPYKVVRTMRNSVCLMEHACSYALIDC